MKKCSHKRCSRHHDTKYKTCQVCREIVRRAHKKRKRLSEGLTVPGGMRLCKGCSHFKPINDFTSRVNRREKLTVHCTSCREIFSKSKKNPTTKRGTCRAFWIEWKKQQTCVDCGCNDWRVIEADHIGKKVHRLSNCTYWTRHGGVEAMKKELKNCEPRCTCCHHIITKKRHNLKRELEGRTQRPCIKRRRDQINQIKLKIGACVVCDRKVTKETCVAFDFDHKDESTKVIQISMSVDRSEAVFQRTMREEIPKCTLKCSNCHHIKTHYKYN
jgi:hypothetical protein